MLTIIQILFLSSVNLIFSEENIESLYNKEYIASSYAEEEFYEDAIIIYQDILNIKKNIFGEFDLQLIETLYKISDLYLKIDNLDLSKQYLGQALYIQQNYLLQQQSIYANTYEKLKSVLLFENDSLQANKIDSLIYLLGEIQIDSLVFSSDTLNFYPKIYNTKNDIDSTKLYSEYSINDRAVDLINSSIYFAKNHLYSEATHSFYEAINLNAKILDNDYLLQINFGDSLFVNKLHDNLLEISNEDSLSHSHYFLLGLLNIKTQQESAIKYFKKDLIFRPNDIRTHMFLGDIYFNKKDYLSSIFHYMRAEKIKPQYVMPKLKIGLNCMKIGKYQDAILKFDEVIKLDINNYLALFNMGLAYNNLNKYDKAVATLTQALLIDSSKDDLYFNIGFAYRNLNLNRQALDAFKQAVNINKENALAHFELGKIYESILKNDLAINEYALAKKYINYDSLNFRYGNLLYDLEKYQEAMEPLRLFVIMNPFHMETLIKLGEIFIMTKRYPEAIDTYSRLIAEYPNEDFYHLQIANCYYNLKNYHRAKEYYLNVIEFIEEDFEIFYQLGKISNELYEFKEAESYFHEAIACGVESKDILFELGIAYGGQKKYLQAMQAFQNALKYSPEDPILHYQLGVVYKELSIFDLAISEFNFYLNYKKDDIIVKQMLGECYYDNEQFEDAINIFKENIEISNYQDIKSLFLTALSYLSIGSDNNAARYFKLVIKINPDHAESRFHLINLYLTLNKSREAKKECDILYMLDRDLYNNIQYCTNL